MAFYFFTRPLSEEYENLDKQVLIQGKKYYYITESDTSLLLLYRQDENAYLMVKLNAGYQFNKKTDEIIDMSIQLEDILESDDFKNSFSFTITKKE